LNNKPPIDAETAPGTPPRPPVGTDQSLIQTQPHTGGEKKNKGGRPKGSKSKTTLLSEAIANDFTRLARSNSRKVFKTLADKAIEGEPWAVKLFMDKIIPNASREQEVKTGDFGITINISSMERSEIKEVIEDGVWEEEKKA